MKLLASRRASWRHKREYEQNMCGIAGIWGRNGDLPGPGGLAALLRHRGPDDYGYWKNDNGLVLEHARLSILDLSQLGHQPMQSGDGRYCIVFNGEIYNFRELREELERDGFSFRGHSDTEVLLNLYVRDGVDAIRRLNGIFAFALWDGVKQELVVVRDPLGVKPLYYAESGKGFCFSSEMKVLLRSGLVAPDLRPEGVLYHLGYLWSPGDVTLVGGVQKLKPGCAMIVRDGKVVRRWRYYDLPYDQPLRQMSVADASQEVVRLVDQAVRRQMVSDVPVGAFLSGGLDSSSIVAFARRYQPETALQCFTISVKGDDRMDEEGFAADEPYARTVAARLGVELHTVTVGREMMNRLGEMLYFLDEPTADPAALNALFIAELARSQGIKVLLSGAGGDDIFTGYRRHDAIAREGLWSWMPQAARSLMACVGSSLPSSYPLLRRIGKVAQYADLDPLRRLVSYFFWMRPAEALALLHPDFRSGLTEQTLFEPLLDSLGEMPGKRERLDQMLYLECKHFLADHNLNYTDKMAMATGVEVRVPLLDPDLVSFSASLPPEMKQRGSVGKWIFRKAMEGYLPNEVIYRPKTGFGVPLRAWLKTALRPMVDELLSARSVQQRGILDWQAVNRLLVRDRSGTIDGSYTIFALICLELWCRQFIDGNYSI